MTAVSRDHNPNLNDRVTGDRETWEDFSEHIPSLSQLTDDRENVRLSYSSQGIVSPLPLKHWFQRESPASDDGNSTTFHSLESNEGNVFLETEQPMDHECLISNDRNQDDLYGDTTELNQEKIVNYEESAEEDRLETVEESDSGSSSTTFTLEYPTLQNKELSTDFNNYCERNHESAQDAEILWKHIDIERNVDLGVFYRVSSLSSSIQTSKREERDVQNVTPDLPVVHDQLPGWGQNNEENKSKSSDEIDVRSWSPVTTLHDDVRNSVALDTGANNERGENEEHSYPEKTDQITIAIDEPLPLNSSSCSSISTVGILVTSENYAPFLAPMTPAIHLDTINEENELRKPKRTDQDIGETKKTVTFSTQTKNSTVVESEASPGGIVNPGFEDTRELGAESDTELMVGGLVIVPEDHNADKKTPAQSGSGNGTTTSPQTTTATPTSVVTCLYDENVWSGVSIIVIIVLFVLWYKAYLFGLNFKSV